MSNLKQLTTRAVTSETVVEMLNREVIPFVRQLAPRSTVTGSRATMTATELQILAILFTAGIATDGTTP